MSFRETVKWTPHGSSGGLGGGVGGAQGGTSATNAASDGTAAGAAPSSSAGAGGACGAAVGFGKVVEATTPNGGLMVRVRAIPLPGPVASALDEQADALKSLLLVTNEVRLL